MNDTFQKHNNLTVIMKQNDSHNIKGFFEIYITKQKLETFK